MFEKAIYNITGAPPFNPKKFPIRIEVGDGMGVKSVFCKSPDDIPQGTDFIILETCATAP
jgi:hypothetical protein